MNCKQTYKFICENLDQDLNSPTCIQIKEHLEKCPKCKANLETLKITISLYKNQRYPQLEKSISDQIIKLAKSEGKRAKCSKRRRAK